MRGGPNVFPLGSGGGLAGLARRGAVCLLLLAPRLPFRRLAIFTRDVTVWHKVEIALGVRQVVLQWKFPSKNATSMGNGGPASEKPNSLIFSAVFGARAASGLPWLPCAAQDAIVSHGHMARQFLSK